jgi:hypothetical protein
MSKPPLWLAIHEVGHAVAMLRLDDLAVVSGPHIREVSLDSTEEYLGIVVRDDRFQMLFADLLPRNHELEWLCRFSMIETLAGPFAEWRQRTNCLCAGVNAAQWSEKILSTVDVSDPDFRQVQARLRWLKPDDPAAELDLLIDYAFAIVRSEWPGIVEAARMLRERRVMDGEDFERTWRMVRPSKEERGRRLARSGLHLPLRLGSRGRRSLHEPPNRDHPP